MKHIDNIGKKHAWLFWLLLLLFLEWLSFRNMYGTEQLFGDLGDGRLTNLITEHWYRFFRGEASFADLGIFYPAQNTLAYSDMFLGFGIIHSLFRFLGMDMYLAFKCTILLVHLLGTIASFYLLRRVLRVRTVWAVFGTAAFSFSDSYITGLLHTQLASLSFLPVTFILIIRFVQNFENRKKRNVYGCLSILMLAVILYSAWYTAFFLAFSFFTFLLVGLAAVLILRIRPGKYLKKWILTLKWDLLGYLLFGAALITPFILLELPVMNMSGGYMFEEISERYLPGLAGLIHVSSGNWMLGEWISRTSWFAGKDHEIIRGFSIVLLLTFVCTFIRHIVRTHRLSPRNGKHIDFRSILCTVISVSTVLDILFMIRWPGTSFSLWEGVFLYFPGGKSIRSVGRYMLFLSFPLSMITAYMAGAEHFSSAPSSSATIKRSFISTIPETVLLVLLILSNLNIVSIKPEGMISPWNRKDALERMAQVAQPPEDCKIFYLSDPSSDQILPLLQTEACEIAYAKNLKTINGYSGLTPEGWGELWDIRGENYQKAAYNWIFDHDIRNVYGYDQIDNLWYFAEIGPE